MAILYTPKSDVAQVAVNRQSYEQLRATISGGGHSRLQTHFPTKDFSERAAIVDAKRDVAFDTQDATFDTGLIAARRHVEESQRTLKEMASTQPWLEGQLGELAAKLTKAMEPLDQLLKDQQNAHSSGRRTVELDELARLEGVRLEGYRTLEGAIVEEYLRSYLATYRAGIKPDYPDHAKPGFYKNGPYHIKAYILPNEAVALLVKAKTSNIQLACVRSSWEEFENALDAVPHDFMASYPPLKPFTKASGSVDAKAAVSADIAIALHQVLLTTTKELVSACEQQMTEIARTNPWLEEPLAKAGNRIQQVTKLLEVLTVTLAKQEQGLRALTEKARTDTLRRFKSPQVGQAPAFEESAAPAPAYVPAPTPAAAPQYETYEEPARGGGGLSEDDRRMIEGLRGELDNSRRKMRDFERRLDYLDNLAGKQQADQNEKFKLQNDIIKGEVRSANKASWGLAAMGLLLGVLAIVANYENLIAIIVRLTGG